jgi:hypothetical protein
VLSLVMMAPSMARAGQQHIADRATLDALVAAQAQQDDADRQELRQLLARSDVREVAVQAGLDITRADAAVGVISGPALRDAASRARVLNERLAGGGSVTLTTTTIIIILLVTILIIVAVK